MYTNQAVIVKTGEQHISIRAADAILAGDLMLPQGARAVVLFAHGSGSSRFSPRNQFIARILGEAGLGTLLIDLLTRREEVIDVLTHEFRFDIDLLARRLEGATDWLRGQSVTSNLKIGYFGASTGAAAALIAATDRTDVVRAIVSRGGRPDLAGDVLGRVEAPTLLVVGALDPVVIEINRKALESLNAEKQMAIVKGASHLFEESGALEEVARLAADWFTRHLAGK